MISLDTETTGTDFHHGCKPFIVTTCGDGPDEAPVFYEWFVDPLTREPEIPPGDLDEIRTAIGRVASWGTWKDPDVRERHVVILQNAKFDVAALKTVIPDLGWPWGQTRDTLRAGHLLASNQPHDLTSMALHYLGVDIQPAEDATEVAVKECRRKVQQAKLRAKRGTTKVRRKSRTVGSGPTSRVVRFDSEGKFVTSDLFADELAHGDDLLPDEDSLANWKIAAKGDPDLPSATDEPWKADLWLPRAFARHFHYPEPVVSCDHTWGPDHTCYSCGGHHFWTVTSEYANLDSSSTVGLWPVMRAEIQRRGLWRIYLEALRVNPIAHAMEWRGVTTSQPRLEELRVDYKAESERCGARCVGIAAKYGYELTLPKSGRNKSLDGFVFDTLKLEKVYNPKNKTAGPTFDNKIAIPHYLNTLDRKSDKYKFIQNLAAKRKRDTYLQYLDGYERFWLPYLVNGEVVPPDLDLSGVFVLHPQLNPTGTHTLRWSSRAPNEQNIGKQGMMCEECFGEKCSACNYTGLDPRNLRHIFGPAPGREWWSLDAQNIELRLPAYASGEPELIDLFERPTEPPYYGSQHLLNFHTVYPDVWDEVLQEVGLEKVGPTCKKRYDGSYYRWCKNGGFAVQYGAVERENGTADLAFRRPGSHAKLKARFSRLEALNQRCIRDATVRGYVETMPDRSVDPRRGYPVMCTRSEWGRVLPTVPFNYYIQSTACWWILRAMVRCEALLARWRREGFDGYIVMNIHDELVFELPAAPPGPDDKPGNLPRVRELQRLMERGGEDVGVPTPCGVEYNPETWAKGVTY